MSEQGRDSVLNLSRGLDNERSSIAFTIAKGSITSSIRVSVFLTSSRVDLVCKGTADTTHLHPMEPMLELMNDILARGGTLACPPCVKARGHTEDDLIDGVAVLGALAMHALILEGSATPSI